ncbi:hypothetical protein RRF57_010049 [Xylaria bambusicola]|uniref:Uncharacterized protein n=1 Tax=Xylaria bambusicola TaxID=326684 RepID=A0AAN7UKM1_9PEZI
MPVVTVNARLLISGTVEEILPFWGFKHRRLFPVHFGYELGEELAGRPPLVEWNWNRRCEALDF